MHLNKYLDGSWDEYMGRGKYLDGSWDEYMGIGVKPEPLGDFEAGLVKLCRGNKYAKNTLRDYIYTLNERRNKIERIKGWKL